jgi:Zn-finger nucleic acid-binding protein
MTDYRTSQALCPGCGTLMSQRIAGDAEIDVCPTCHGIWVDWFDGDLQKVAHDAAPIEPGQPVGGGTSLCPRCTQPLHFEKLLRRCSDCAGTFVPRSAFDDLLVHEEPKKEDPTAFQRLMKVLRELIQGPTIEVED